MRLRRWLACMLALAVLIAGGPARAQEDEGGHLSDEQRALIARVVQTNLDDYQSHHTESSGTDRQTVTLSFGGAARTFEQTVMWSQSVDLVKVDGEKNVQAMASATVSQPDTVNYTVNAEARLVGGVLYVKAAFVPPALDQIKLPDGWVIVEDSAHQDVYEYLQLDDLIDGRSRLYDDAALLERLVSDVTLETRTLDDGTPVEAITLYFDRDGVVQSLRATQNAGAAAPSDVILDAVSANSYSTAVLMIVPDGMPVRFESTMWIETAAVDGHALAPDQYGEGVTLAFVLDRSTVRAYSRIDEPVKPASVPDELAAE
jgi:hypothetical protein